MRTIRSGCHIAHLDDLTGVGMLVCPAPEDDLPMMGDTSTGLHEADWNSITDRLYLEGWEILMDDDDLHIEEGRTARGEHVIALYGLSPVIEQPCMEHLTQAHAELSATVGL